MFKRLSSWFLTEKGRTFSVFVVAGVSATSFCVPFVPNTFLIEQYTNLVHLYKKGLSVPVPAYLNERFQKALELANIPENEVHIYRPFNVIGFDMFHIGSSYSKFGCNIGLPINFTYKDVDTIDRHKIKILGESVAWDLPEGKQFLNAVVLSEKAQLYAMAREMRMTQTPELYLNSLYPTLSIITAFGIGRRINTAFNFYAKPLAVRMIVYSLVSTFCLMNYFLFKDFTQMHYEKQVDEELKKNPILAEGAIEFYDKILRRNQALRTLMGSEGVAMYSVLGNENYLIRQQHLPLVQRKAFFEEKVNELKA